MTHFSWTLEFLLPKTPGALALRVSTDTVRERARLMLLDANKTYLKIFIFRLACLIRPDRS